MRRLTVRALPALLAVLMPALGAAGCGDDPISTSTNTSTSPSILVTETYTGTVSVGGAAVFSFGVTGSGNVTGTFKSISPDTGVAMGISLGIWNGASCSVVVANDNAFVNSTVIGAASAAGTLCVRAYDIGKLTATQTVELSVTHY